MRVLITDGDERAALATARSLIAAGYEVHATAARRWSLAGVSRGVRRWVVRADPLAEPGAYAGEVGRLARDLDVRVLLAVTDPSVDALLEFGRALPPSVVLPFPDLATYRRASDKAEMVRLACSVGLAVPETWVVRERGSELPGAGFFPAVIKPHRSVVAAAACSPRLKTTVSHVVDHAACRAALAVLPDPAFPVLLQQRVRGPGEGLFLLRWNGRVVAAFSHRRLREKPPAGGVSVYRESIAATPELVAAGTGLLELLDWQGVAMIECKRDLDSGRHVLMEINGRLWGSLQLAIDAGVDFPALLVAAALGESVPVVTDYRLGVRSRWFWGDVDHLYLRLRDSSGWAGRLTAVRDFFRLGSGDDHEEIWRWGDPAPFIVETLARLGVGRRKP